MRRGQWTAVLLMTAITSSVLAAPAQAGRSSGTGCSVTVGRTTTGPNSVALQDAIDAAPSGSTIKVEGLCTGNYTITSKTLQISAGRAGAVIDGNLEGRVFDITLDTGQSVALSGLTIRRGNVDGDGAGLRVSGSGVLSVVNTTITTNYATNYGGGIYCATGASDPELQVVGSTISGNTGSYGGGIFIEGGCNARLSGSTQVLDNISSYRGAGVYTRTSLTLSGPTSTRSKPLLIDRNWAKSQQGGGIFIEGSQDLTLLGYSYISGNRVSGGGSGGAIGTEGAGITPTTTSWLGSSCTGPDGPNTPDDYDARTLTACSP